MTIHRNIPRAVLVGVISALAACSSEINAPVPQSAAPVASASLAMQSTRIQIGSTGEVVAVVRDAAGQMLMDREVSWSSSDPAVASVATSGPQRATVTGKLGGSAVISGAVEGVTATVEIVTLPVAPSSTARSQAFIYSPGEGMIAIPAAPGVTMSWASAINESGEVVGGMIINGKARAFLWTSGTGMVDLGTLPGGSQSGANAINARGEVVGWSSSESSAEHAFKWSKETGMIDLGVPPWTNTSEATGINASGEVVGFSGDPEGERAFRWTVAGGMADMGVLDGSVSSAAYAIGDDGTAVGTSRGNSTSLNQESAVMWTSHNGIITIFDCGSDDGGDCSVVALGMNQRGSIVGQLGGTAVLWTMSGGRPKTEMMGVMPGAVYSAATAINDSGQVVGTNSYLTGQRAFLWTAAAGMRDMGAIPGTTVCSPAGINNHGFVVGFCL